MLRTRSPLLFKCIATSEKPFDLHVLTTPPAFILSQDQTLRKKRVTNPSDSWTTWMVRTRRSAPYTIWNNVDWGSQSIAQSKFQRTAPQEGKDFQENIRILLRQSFSRNIRKEFCEGTAGFSFSSFASPAIGARYWTQGAGTCESRFHYQDLFRENI